MAPGHSSSREGKKTQQTGVVVVIILVWSEFSGAGEAAWWEALRLLLGPAREGKEGPSPAWPGPRCSPARLWLFWGTPSSEIRHLPVEFGENPSLGSLAPFPERPWGRPGPGEAAGRPCCPCGL